MLQVQALTESKVKLVEELVAPEYSCDMARLRYARQLVFLSV
jgi:hypothetical protein